jgi:competence protein ComEC
MRTGCTLFVCGVLCLLYRPHLPPPTLIYLLPLCLISGFYLRLVRWPVFFVCGFIWAAFRADIILEKQIPQFLEGQILLVEGVVSSLPTHSDRGQRFIFKINRLTDERGLEHQHRAKVLLSWYRTNAVLIPGDSWRFRVKLKRPHGFLNPGGFDYEGWLFQNRITATGYVIDKRVNAHLLEQKSITIHSLRYKVRQRLVSVIGDKQSAALIPALVIGDKSNISAKHWQTLTKTGTNHLLAISGLHIGLVAGMVYFLVRRFWPLAYYSALLLPSPKAASIAALLAALSYSALAGFAVPTQRAVIMLSMLLGAGLFSVKLSPVSILLFSLLIIIIIDPFAPLSAGLWLSFFAVLMIIYCMSARINVNSLWWRWGRVQYIVAVGLMPVLVIWFKQIPLTSIGANLVAVPWVSFLTVPLILLGSVLHYINESMGAWLLETGVKSLDLLWPFLQKLADLEFNLVTFAAPSRFSAIAIFCGVFLLLAPKGIPARWIGVFWLFPLIFPLQDKLDYGLAKLTLLDVGQGLAAVLETRNHRILYDTGPRYSDRFDAGSGVIFPLLRSQNVKAVNLLVQSHGDNDHIGGLKSLQNLIRIDEIMTSVVDEIDHNNVKECRNGRSWDWDGVQFEILHPGINSKLTGNDRSCVLRVSVGEQAILFTGDIEAKAEKAILQRDKSKISSTILIAPHHGSRSSSSHAFIEAVGPELVLFPVGYRNRFGFPKQDIINRYRERNVKIMTTAQDGAIEIGIGADTLIIKRQRRVAKRFWHITK